MIEQDLQRGIPRRRIRAPLWTCEEDALLGSQPDARIAHLIGRSAQAVCLRRLRLGIDQHRVAPRSVPVRRGSKGNYLLTYLPVGHPFRGMTRSRGDVLMHRLVMAEHLGRPLTRDEFVHHRNGNGDDNRVENLELWTRAHPDGQRVEDVLAWAVEFVERYAKECG